MKEIQWATGPKKEQNIIAREIHYINSFRKLAVTTNDEKNADSFQFSNFPYISRAGGRLRLLRRSWLFDAFPGFSFLPPSTNNHNMPISNQEQKLYDALKPALCTKIYQSFRPNFLKNPKTGQNLEIDLYLPEYKVGFEYQGAVHFKGIESYRNDHDKARLHDTKKAELLENTIHRRAVIVEIFEQDLEGDIIANVKDRLKNNIAYHYKYRHFAKCAQLQMVLNKLIPENDAGKKRVKYYEFLYKTQTCLKRERRYHFRNLEMYINEFPYVTDMRYTGEEIDLKITPEHEEIRNTPPNRVLLAMITHGEDKPLEVAGATVTVTEKREVIISAPVTFTYEDWKAVTRFAKEKFRLLNVNE